MADIKEILDVYIYPNLNKALIISELAPVDKGSYFQCLCPSCGKKNHIYTRKVFTSTAAV